jgi:2-dehydropantoate 2-reductase
MRIVVVGSGGVGGYFGARLVRAGHDVTFISRGAHLTAMQESGLQIHSAEDGDWHVDCRAVDHIDPGPAAELVLVCVKSRDTLDAAHLVMPIVDTDTVVLSLQNGVDNEEKLRAALPPCRLFGGVAYVFANIVQPGVIAHHQFGSIVIGDIEGGIDPRAGLLVDAFKDASIGCRADPDIVSVLWQKYVFLVALSGITAATRQPAGVIRNVPEARLTWRKQVEELIGLAAALDIALPGDMAENCDKVFESLAAENYSSLYHDIANEKPSELEALHGHAVKLAATKAVPVPTLSAIYGVLKAQTGPR